MMKSLGYLVAVTGALGCACGGESALGGTGPPSVELGTGRSSFEALANGNPILVIQGPQGGYHLLGSVRAQNINAGNVSDLSDPSNPTTTYEVYLGDRRVDGMASVYTQGLKAFSSGVEMIGRLVILDIADDSELEGEALRFIVSITDVDGLELSDERIVVGRADPNNL